MTLVGCDLHARKQQVAVLDTTTGGVLEQELVHDGIRLPFSSPRRRSPLEGSIARLPKTVFRDSSANGITTRGTRAASIGRPLRRSRR
jgi:hypothetical protein